MSATIHRLHNTQPIAAFLRVGHRDHRWLEERQAASNLPIRRFVFEAAHIGAQRSLVDQLRAAGCEIVLDTNFAELGSLGRFNGAVSRLPWAIEGRPWQTDDFGGNRTAYVASQMAEFAVANDVAVVLSPSHLLEEDDEWMALDLALFDALRRALDSAGGSHIALDYHLIATAALLKEEEFRASIKQDLSGIVADNLWLRTSGFDAHSTGTGTRRYIEALRDLHEIKLPFVADMTGGFPALAAASSGAVGGISHGLARKEAFRAADYRRVPTGGGGGGTKRIYLADLDRWVNEEQFLAMTSTRGVRSRLVCTDTACCAQGRDDMIDNPKGHFITQRIRQIEDLSRVPEARREEHFLLRHLAPALRTVRALSKTRFENQSISFLLQKERKRLSSMIDVFGALLSETESDTRSSTPVFRGAAGGLALLGRQI